MARRWVVALALMAGPSPSARAAAPVDDSPRAFLLEVTLQAHRLESRDAQGQLGAPLTELRRNLHEAELYLAKHDEKRFSQVRAEISAQLAWIDALLSKAEVDGSLAQTNLLLSQAALSLADAEERARQAEAKAGVVPAMVPSAPGPTSTPAVP